MGVADYQQRDQVERCGQSMPVFKTKLGKVAGGISPTRRSRSGTEINQTENQSERNSDKDKGKSDRIEKKYEFVRLEIKVEIGKRKHCPS